MQNRLMQIVEDTQIRKDAGNFTIGDQVDVHQRILEGEKERTQIFTGVVIARKGSGLRETFVVRRIVQSEGVERTFPVHSPKIAKVEVKRTGAVRRAKLYYLRDRVGKATRLRERKPKAVVPGTTAPAPAAAAPTPAPAAK
jgi:large subunit ribosomal protein L19